MGTVYFSLVKNINYLPHSMKYNCYSTRKVKYPLCTAIQFNTLVDVNRTNNESMSQPHLIGINTVKDKTKMEIISDCDY